MAEIPGRADTLIEIQAHLLALGRLMPKGPPDWAHHDLTFGQLRLLFVLGQSEPVSIGQLADTLGVTDATASEIVDRVERRGLAVRSHRADDRRVVDCRLSDEGARLLAEIQGARQESIRRVLAVLSADELSDLDRLLRTMAERLSAASSSPTSTEGATPVSPETPGMGPVTTPGGGRA
jgi:DNA-binding MarR family transcriptional regulator